MRQAARPDLVLRPDDGLDLFEKPGIELAGVPDLLATEAKAHRLGDEEEPVRRRPGERRADHVRVVEAPFVGDGVEDDLRTLPNVDDALHAHHADLPPSITATMRRGAIGRTGRRTRRTRYLRVAEETDAGRGMPGCGRSGHRSSSPARS